MLAKINDDRQKIEQVGIKIPENGKIESFPVRPNSHDHQLFKCLPLDFAWKCKGSSF